MWNDFIALIFPRTCTNCNRSLTSVEHCLCVYCKTDLPFTDDHAYKENELFRKFAFLPKIESARSFLYFRQRGVTQKLLHQLKYQGRNDVGEALAKWFAPFLKDLPIDLVLPVPLHKSKKRKRGYNQSEILAQHIADELGIDMRNDVITRIRSIKSQTKKSKIQRWQGMENVYSGADDLIRGKSVLVIDDVITTGATIGMLCERLSDKNVKEIHIACIARGD